MIFVASAYSVLVMLWCGNSPEDCYVSFWGVKIMGSLRYDSQVQA